MLVVVRAPVVSAMVFYFSLVRLVWVLLTYRACVTAASERQDTATSSRGRDDLLAQIHLLAATACAAAAAFQVCGVRYTVPLIVGGLARPCCHVGQPPE